MRWLEYALTGFGVAFFTLLDFAFYYILVEYGNMDPFIAALLVVCSSINGVRLKIKS